MKHDIKGMFYRNADFAVDSLYFEGVGAGRETASWAMMRACHPG
jgi:hypothetical protein